MAKSIWKLRWRCPSKFGWVIRLLLLAICCFIWINSYRASHGGTFAWPEDPNVYAKKQMNPDPPIIIFYWDRFCLNLNKSRMPAVHPGVPIRFAYYVHVSGKDPNPTEAWQFFHYGFVVPVWALSVFAAAVTVLVWSPRIFRARTGFCSGCNYDLRGLKDTSTSCPECGAATDV